MDQHNINHFVCQSNHIDLTEQERRILRLETELAIEPDEFWEWMLIYYPHKI